MRSMLRMMSSTWCGQPARFVPRGNFTISGTWITSSHSDLPCAYPPWSYSSSP